MIDNRALLKAGVATLAVTLFATPAFAQTVNTPNCATDPNAPNCETDAGAGPVEGQSNASDATGRGAQGVDTGAIIVTGSRIPQPNLESASPITVVNSQEVRNTGTTRVEDLVNSLPQVFAGQGSNISNGSTGTATINLRGLGSERNLVLVNGRRLVPGDPSSSAADVNMIPAALISRIDVLTGGASSVYGADAVTGVVNFILDTKFEGFRVDGQYSFYDHVNRANASVINALNARGFGYPRGHSANGGTIDTTVAFGAGTADGRGHVTAYVGYRQIEAILQGSRDYSSCALSPNSTKAVAGGANLYTCGGSLTSPTGTFIINSGGTSTFFQVGNGRVLVPGFTRYNYAPLNYFQRPDERYTAGLFADYEITPAIKPYLEFMFMNDRTVAQIAPSGDFGNTFSINCDNPLLSAQQLALICSAENTLINPNGSVGVTPTTPAFVFTDPVSGRTYTRGFAQILRRNVEGGGRRDDLEHTEYRVVAGVRGDLNNAFSYDAYYLFGRTIFAETYLNDFSVTRLTNALDVITGPNGTPICRSAQPGGSDPNCVPYDIFAPGQVTQAAINYLQTPGFQRGNNGEIVISGSITGQLGEYGIRSPFADEGISFAAGAEYRKESLDFNSDTTFQTGDLAGQGAPTLPVSGEFKVTEGFAEVRLPLVSGGFFNDLTLTGGYRFSHYTVPTGATTNRSFDTDTYKAEFEFAPIRDIRLRGGYNRAVRVPTVQDLFAPQRVALDGSTDPCAGAPITAAQVGCLAQGLTVGQVVAANPASQYNGLIGGNPNLNPEIADTFTAGVVLQPSFIPRLAVTVDFFDIKLTQAISGIGADTILASCTTTVSPLCALVKRDQFGSLFRSSNGYVIDTTQNIGGLGTRGIDINASYSRDLGSLGSVNLSFVGTYLDRLNVTNSVGTYNCKNLYGSQCGTPNPDWRHQARVSFVFPDGIGASLRWRYFGPVREDTTSTNPLLAGTTTPANQRIGAVNYYDLALTFRVSDHYNFRLGANNLLDRQPPLSSGAACPAGSCNGNVYAQVYDAIGRYIYAGVTLDF